MSFTPWQKPKIKKFHVSYVVDIEMYRLHKSTHTLYVTLQVSDLLNKVLWDVTNLSLWTSDKNVVFLGLLDLKDENTMIL